jgi:hypothetical protein
MAITMLRPSRGTETSAWSPADASGTVELWRWRYFCAETGRMEETMLPMTEQEAAHLAGSRAERITGSRIVVEAAHDEFEDTLPGSLPT